MLSARRHLTGCAALALSCQIGAPNNYDAVLAEGPDAGQPPEVDAAPLPPIAIDPETPPSAVFAAIVQPRLEAECAACHADDNPATGPDFLKPPDYYESLMQGTTLEGQPLIGATLESSYLVLEGAHAGPALSPEAIAAIDAWLGAEANYEPPEPPKPIAQNRDEALQWFSTCLTYERWQTYQMERLPTQLTDREPCYACHDEGQHGTYLSLSARDTHAAHADPAGTNILHLVSPYFREGAFAGLVPAGRYIYQGAQPQHPNFTLEDLVKSNLELLVDEVIEASKYGPCPPPPPGGPPP